MEDFLINVRDYMILRSRLHNTPDPIEEVIAYIFSCDDPDDFRADVAFAANQMLIGATEPDVEAALDSQLPAILAQSLRYSG